MILCCVGTPLSSAAPSVFSWKPTPTATRQAATRPPHAASVVRIKSRCQRPSFPGNTHGSHDQRTNSLDNSNVSRVLTSFQLRHWVCCAGAAHTAGRTLWRMGVLVSPESDRKPAHARGGVALEALARPRRSEQRRARLLHTQVDSVYLRGVRSRSQLSSDPRGVLWRFTEDGGQRLPEPSPY